MLKNVLLLYTSRTRVFVLGVVLLHLLLYLLVQLLPGLPLYSSNFFGWLMLISAGWLSIFACLAAAAREDSQLRIRWGLYAGSIVLQSIAVIIYFLAFLLPGVPLLISTLPVYFFLLSSIPVYFALALSLDESETSFVRRLDVISAVAAAILFFLLIVSVIDTTAAVSHGNSAVDIIVDVDNLFLTGFAAIRLLGLRAESERRFFVPILGILLCTSLISAIRNRAIVHSNGPLWNTLLDIRFLLPLLIVAGLPYLRLAHQLSFSHKLARISRIGISAFMALGLVLLGVALSHFHYAIGAFGVLFAVAVYGIRTSLVQEKSILIDLLTGIPNRRFLAETMEREWYHSSRSQLPIALLMVDIDHFKLINDRYGHHYGDLALTRIASTLQSSLTRAADFVGRYGGEEFLVVLPVTGQEGALALAHRLCERVAALQLENAASPSGVITISIGLAVGRHGDYPSPVEFIAAADAALYQAKTRGRNCVDITPQPESTSAVYVR